MSIKAMVYVWGTPYKGAQKLMLLAIADRCDDEGVCFPGVGTLAKKCSINDRNAQKMIVQLEKLGEVSVVFNKGFETTHGSTNLYFMKQYRDSLGLTTPAPSKRKKKKGVSSATSQEVSRTTSQEVSSATPNTPEETPEETKDFASDDARTQEFSSTEPAPVEAALKGKNPRKRSAKQTALSEAMETLAKAMGVTLMAHDYSAYNDVATALINGTVTPAEFDLYVRRLKKRAKQEKWQLRSVYALIAKERITEYVTARNNYLKEQESGEAVAQWDGEDSAAVTYHEVYQPAPAVTDISEDQRAAALQDVQAGLQALRDKKAKVMA